MMTTKITLERSIVKPTWKLCANKLSLIDTLSNKTGVEHRSAVLVMKIRRSVVSLALFFPIRRRMKNKK